MTIGLVGLGIMGTAYAKNFIAEGQKVAGADPSEGARNRCAALGVEVHEAAGAWLADCDLVITSLVSPTVLAEVALVLAQVLKPGQVVAETGTFALSDKEKAHAILAEANITLLDCTVSGTGVQAANKDILFMASDQPFAPVEQLGQGVLQQRQCARLLAHITDDGFV